MIAYTKETTLLQQKVHLERSTQRALCSILALLASFYVYLSFEAYAQSYGLHKLGHARKYIKYVIMLY